MGVYHRNTHNIFNNFFSHICLQFHSFPLLHQDMIFGRCVIKYDQTHSKGLPLICTDTFHSIHSPTPAGPPTLLEDGQRYRGNQLKQSLDGWEVVCLAGKDMHHLKQQDFTSDTHCVYLNTRNQVIGGKTGYGRKPENCFLYTTLQPAEFYFSFFFCCSIWRHNEKTSSVVSCFCVQMCLNFTNNPQFICGSRIYFSVIFSSSWTLDWINLNAKIYLCGKKHT